MRHYVEDYLEWFPPSLRAPGSTSQSRKQAVVAAIQRTTRLVEHDPRTAVMQYVRTPDPCMPGCLQMLLPLKLVGRCKLDPGVKAPLV